jgi:hypothetical protein
MVRTKAVQLRCKNRYEPTLYSSGEVKWHDLMYNRSSLTCYVLGQMNEVCCLVNLAHSFNDSFNDLLNDCYHRSSLDSSLDSSHNHGSSYERCHLS